MKKATFTYTMEFPDKYSDDDCIQVLLEVMGQDRNYTDDQFKIEQIPSKEFLEAMKLVNFKVKAYEKAEELNRMVNEDLVDDGNTEETSQRICLLNAINHVHMAINGTEETDLK